jgi:hypothetical protein
VQEQAARLRRAEEQHSEVMSPVVPGSSSARLDVGGLSIALEADRPLERVGFGRAYHPFLSGASDLRAPDLALGLAWGALPEGVIGEGEAVFESSGLWSLRRAGGKLVFVLRAPERGNAPYRVAVLEEDLSRGRIVSTPGGRMDAPAPLLPDPLEYPLGEAMMVCLLARHGGLMVHACGVDDGGRGILFAGQSGHGKTTMARLWRGEARVLNDDRIVLRIEEGRLVMYGTPWHGDHPEVGPGGVPVGRILFLSHAPSNAITAVQASDAASRLLARSFPPLWSQDGMSRTLDFLGGIAGLAPCADLGFAPAKDVVAFVRGQG